MDHFKDKVAIVTGGASGLGEALCQELARQGAVVVAADVNLKGAEQVADAVNKNGGRAEPVQLDVTNAEAVSKLVAETAAGHGRLDYMFNNAGVTVIGELRDTSLEQWQRLIDINLWGVINGTTAAYNLMVEQKSGHIVNVASLSGLMSYPTVAAYAASKHAVVGLSTSLRAEAAGLGIKVSTVCPGAIMTRIWATAPVLAADKKDYYAKSPLKIIEAPHAAKIILHQVLRNRAIIVFPFQARFHWWLSRIHPVLLTPINRKRVDYLRAIRREK